MIPVAMLGRNPFTSCVGPWQGVDLEFEPYRTLVPGLPCFPPSTLRQRLAFSNHSDLAPRPLISAVLAKKLDKTD